MTGQDEGIGGGTIALQLITISSFEHLSCLEYADVKMGHIPYDYHRVLQSWFGMGG